MSTRFAAHLAALVWLLLSAAVHALETDQFYAWGKPIEDSAEYLNAWTRLQFDAVLEETTEDPALDCEAVVESVRGSLQQLIYQPIETWILASDLVDRIPRGLEESREYREQYLLAHTFPLDFARWLPPSPTLDVNGIRFGSDKLAHFFSEGWWYYRWWQKNRQEETADELNRRMANFGANLEKWVMGPTVTGVFSPADMEANYQGFVFYHALCHGDPPLLSRQSGRWHFSKSFDFRDYVSPEWDESWNANTYGKLRWKGIRSAMLDYCPMLNSDWVKQQRESYRQRDRQTPTEIRIRELVADGKLLDPRQFDITSVCSGNASPESISGRP